MIAACFVNVAPDLNSARLQIRFI